MKGKEYEITAFYFRIRVAGYEDHMGRSAEDAAGNSGESENDRVE